MDRTAIRPATRLAPAAWAGLAVGTTLVAAVLAGALRSTTLPALLGTGITRAATDVAGVTCVGLALLGVLLPVGRRELAGEAGRVRTLVDRTLVAAGGAWLVVALLGIAFRAADGYGRPVTTLTGAGRARLGDRAGGGPRRAAHGGVRRGRARVRGGPAA